MQFLLTGGGDFEHFHKMDRLYCDLLSPSSTIQVLPFAVDPEDYDEILERLEDSYNSNSKFNFSMNSNPETLTAEDVAAAGSIFIEGGNTFDLITALRKSNLETTLRQLNQNSPTIFYADSAGAIILGKSVQTAFFGDDADDDEARLQDYRGVDLLQSWSIHAHYTPEDDDQVMDFVYSEGTPVLGLFEETGIHIDATGRVEVVAEAPVAVFTAAGKALIEQGDEFNLSEYF